MKNRDLTIIKASGETALFAPEKLTQSLYRSGASAQQVTAILRAVEDILHPGITTKKIYQTAYKLLRNWEKPIAARYKLKSAIMELGPSGFPFERYIAAILQEQGYQTQVGVIVEGKCVKHEVDIVARRNEYQCMIECKYHSQQGTVCDVKIPLYIHSRFRDVEARWEELHGTKRYQGWLVTNTRFTYDAVRYGTCMGLHLLGWDYPEQESLNKQIEQVGLYPLTCLTTLSKGEKQSLMKLDAVLCKEILENPSLLKKAGVHSNREKNILEESGQLCHRMQTDKDQNRESNEKFARR